jgi:hypothetical protein
VTSHPEHPLHHDQDMHKGAIEGDRPADEQFGNENGNGLDDDGMPNDQVATYQDRVGAKVDNTQG